MEIMLVFKRIFSFAVFLIFIQSLSAQNGAPLLSHYKESREIENQSWAICQDQNSVMMFANRRGILTFDGQDWNTIPMPAIPYSLKYNSENKRVYVGCDNRYGYLEKDEKGFYKYISLSGDSAGVGLITRIIFTDSTIYFYGELSISRHNLKSGLLEKRFASKENEPFTGMFITPKNTFINVMSKGLYRLEADTLFPIVTGYLLEHEEVLFSLPYDNNLVLLGLEKGSLSLFDGIKFYDYQIKDDGYLRQNILSEGITVSDSLYAFSTLDGGALVVGKKSGKLLYTINYQNGLPDDEILALGSDHTNGLWLSHQYGLSRADLGLPVGNFSIYPGIKGNLTTSIWHNNELYVASSEGVFYLIEVKNYAEVEVLVKNDRIKTGFNIPVNIIAPALQHQEVQKTKKGLLSRIFGKKTTTVVKEEVITPSVKQGENIQIPAVKASESRYIRKTVSRLKSVNYIFKKVDGLNEKCKQLVSTPFGILASTNKGLYNISGHTAKVIVNDRYINFISERTDDNIYYIATSEGYFYISNNSGKWTAVFPDKNFIQPIYSITSVNNDLLWAGGYNIAYKISMNQGVPSGSYRTYTTKNDYPQKYIVEFVNDTVFLLTESGVSFYDERSDSLKQYIRLDLQKGSKLNFIYTQPDVPWFNRGDEWMYLSADKKVAGNDKALLKIFNDVISIYTSGEFIWVATGDNQLYRIELNKILSIRPDLDLYIRSISNENGVYFKLSDIVFGRGDNTVYFDLVAPGYLKQNSTQYQYLVENIMTDWSKWQSGSMITLMPPSGNFTLKVRAKDIWGNISEPRSLNFTIKAPFTESTLFSVIVSVIALLVIIAIVNFRERQLKKDKRILEARVKERTAEIEAQKQEITSSIEYASRIQMAMLPVEDHFRNAFSDHFVFFKPRDIVSGDFYWIGEDEKHVFFTVADCTGHGVPGAFMSTMGISTLNEIITNKSDLQANTVLNLLRDKTKTSLHQTGKVGEAADGMDVAFCVLHKSRKTLEYSGAYNSLFIVQGGEFKEYKADRMPIGIYYGEKESFTNYEINVNKGDTVYIFSDGFSDQFGGPRGTKYKKSNLKKLLSEIYLKPMAEQRQILENEFTKWKGEADQVDDITIIGVRI
jgi:serine phosphatase RsbU (regulator of sigma subunit)